MHSDDSAIKTMSQSSDLFVKGRIKKVLRDYSAIPNQHNLFKTTLLKFSSS